MDTINLVKRKHKQLKVQRSLSAKRSQLTRATDASKVSTISHEHGRSATFQYQRDSARKVARLSQETPDLSSPQRSRRSASRLTRSPTSAQRTKSLEVSQRLLGSVAF